MFKVNVYWDEHKYSEGYHYYKYAVKAFEALNEALRELKANGRINEYYVELIKEE